MVYITVKQPPAYHQYSLEEFLFGDEIPSSSNDEKSETNTRTYERFFVSDRIARKLNVNIFDLIQKLSEFNRKTESLRQRPRHELYYNFYTEKSDGDYPAVFRGIFKKQSHFVPCDTGKFCSEVTAALRPLVMVHPATDHDRLYESTVRNIISIAESYGFHLSAEDFQEIFSSAFRKIDAPHDEAGSDLMGALRELKGIFEDDFKALYHTSAFAYIKKRCTIDAIKRHQENESRWFAKFDLHNFFGSTTLEFIMKMLAMVYPFSDVIAHPAGKEELQKALELAILNGGLPQGTPISPLITNIMMIPVDFKLSNKLRNFEKQRYIYTRYADDFQISSRFDFDYREVERLIEDTLAEFGAPFTLNTSKTRYGSSAGRNWNLGVMLNADNKITVGHEKKRRFKAMISSYIQDRKHGVLWDKNEIQVMEGLRSYYRMIERDTIDEYVERANRKYNVDLVKMIKADLKSLS